MANSLKQSFLNTLFQWTVKTTAAEPKPPPTPPTTTADSLQPMSEDSKKWLNSAIENITVNPVERLKICINKLKDPQTSPQQKKEFLDELCHWSEELDLAKDFFTIGGLDILPQLLDSDNDEIRIQTCSLLATLVQNNEYCQKIIVQSGLQEKLLKILDQSTNADLKIKAVSAISALIRGYTLGQLQLQKFQGIKILIRALSLPIPRLQNKLCFLINTICSSSGHMKKLFYKNGALVEFIRLFTNETCLDYQHLLETILTLSNGKSNPLDKCDGLFIEQFKQKLNERLQTLDNLEEHQDEITIINQISTSMNLSQAEEK